MTTPNAELAYKTLDLINANPDRFRMDLWASGRPNAIGLDDLTKPADVNACGTTACFAGWAAALSGYKVTVGGEVLKGDELASDNIQAFAANLLGISDDEADDLFYVEDEDITDAVAEIFGPRPDGGA